MQLTQNILQLYQNPELGKKMSGNAVRLYTEKYAKGIGLNKYAALFKNILRTANYAASRDPRRGETPVMCASTVQVAALPGEVVSNTGKQNRKVLAAPVMESFASITGVTTLLRQKHGNCPPPPIFLHSIPFSFVRRSNHYLLLIPSSDGSHACAAEMVRYREERNYEP